MKKLMSYANQIKLRNPIGQKLTDEKWFSNILASFPSDAITLTNYFPCNLDRTKINIGIWRPIFNDLEPQTIYRTNHKDNSLFIIILIACVLKSFEQFVSGICWNRAKMSVGSGLIRFFLLIYYIYVVWYDVTVIGLNYNKALLPLAQFLNARMMYITHWAVFTQIVYLFVALLNDIFGSNERRPGKPSLIRKVRDYIFTVFAFSIAYFVAIIFWTLYFYDKQLLLPLDGWKMIPWFLFFNIV